MDLQNTISLDKATGYGTIIRSKGELQ